MTKLQPVIPVNIPVSTIHISADTVEDSHGANDAYLCGKACDGGDRFPDAPAEGLEYPSDHAADGSEYQVADLTLIQQTKRPDTDGDVGEKAWAALIR